jgi:hypothetical protein
LANLPAVQEDLAPVAVPPALALDPDSLRLGFETLNGQRAAESKFKKSSLESKFKRLAKFWNSSKLRHGDCIRLPGDAKNTHHKDQWNLGGVHIISYRSVGYHAPRGEEHGDIEQTHRNLDLVTASASVHNLAQKYAVQAQMLAPMDLSCRKMKPILYSLNYDATPIKVDFGGLQELVAPHARYYLPKANGEAGYDCVDLSGWIARCHGRSLPQKGVLEMLAVNARIDWIDDAGSSRHESLIVPSCFLQHANASNTHSSIEALIPDFSLQALIAMASPHPLRFGLYI